MIHLPNYQLAAEFLHEVHHAIYKTVATIIKLVIAETNEFSWSQQQQFNLLYTLFPSETM